MSEHSEPKDNTPQQLPGGATPAVPPTQEPPTEPVELRRSDLDSSVKRQEAAEPIARRRTLPLVLFIATCLSTFWVGAAKWEPMLALGVRPTVSESILFVVRDNWQEGLLYMGAVLAILLTHEMGHFLQTIRHRIPASYPLCIPVPINPIGTMGAVISMDGMRADRKQIFDIGIAGPLAGLIVAVPILWIGVGQLDLSLPPDPGQVGRDVQLNTPLIVKWMMQSRHPEFGNVEWIGISRMNAWYMAGWVGMLITGLNMLPISQLDGGHTLYGLFGEKSHVYARGFVIAAIAYVVAYIEQAAIWTPMLILVILMGVHHPPTSNDNVELDKYRWLLGVASLSIPIICFPLLGLKQ